MVVLLAGMAGGVVRGLVGFVKHQYSYKNVKFDVIYFLVMMAISGIIGLTVSWALVESGVKILGDMELNSGLAFFVGYAGGDFVENIYKIITKKTTWPVPKAATK